MIKNPIISGFNADPSIVRVKDTYYIACSTFEWWPGVQIHESKDLVHWHLIAHPLNETRLLDMKGNPDSAGIWAPDLSWCDGKFYLVYTDVKVTEGAYKDCTNYLITAEDIMGPWSDPVELNTSGFDASLFHDEDGKKYLLNMCWDPRTHHHPFYGIMCTEYSDKEKRLVGAPKIIYTGTSEKLTEGPHIYRYNGYYYLFVAQGGTVYTHQERVARARSLNDTFESMPGYPLITQYDAPFHPLQKSGHGSLVETQNGEWYFVHLMSRPLHHANESVIDPRGWCPLGRETGIQKIEWREDGWPYVVGGHNGREYVEEPAGITECGWEMSYPEKDDFDDLELNINFQSLRIPLGEDIMTLKERPGHLRLYGRQSLTSTFTQAHIARRWEDFFFDAETKVEYEPDSFLQMAGLSCYYNTKNWTCICVTWDEYAGKCIHLLCNDRAGLTYVWKDHPVPVPAGQKEVYFRVKVRALEYEYEYSFDGENWKGTGVFFDSAKLSDDYIKETYDGAFTGAFTGMFSVDGMGTHKPADFDYFSYKKLEEAQSK